MGLTKRVIDKIKNNVIRDRRRFPRYEIGNSDQIKAFFSLDGIRAYLNDIPGIPEHEHPIINLSQNGIALFLLNDEDPDFFRDRPKLSLRLDIGGQQLILSCRVSYILAGIKRIGLKFLNVSEEQLEVISRFLDARFLAQSMKEVPIKERGGTCENCRWFHGQNSTDLFSWRTPEGEYKQHLFIFGNEVVEWTKRYGLQTGTMDRPDFALTYTILFSKEPNPISLDETTDASKVERASSILKLSNIDPGLKEHFFGILA
jgi:hypothetical protein